MYRFRWLMYIVMALLLASLVTSCQGVPRLADLPDLLQRSLGELESYQIKFELLDQGTGSEYTATQWYKSPELLRTDVLERGELCYRFFVAQGQLKVHDVLRDQWGEITLGEQDGLYTLPLLKTLWEAGAQIEWDAGDGRDTWEGQFAWNGHPGLLVIDNRTLFPDQVRLDLGAGQLLVLEFETIVLNLPLADQLLQP